MEDVHPVLLKIYGDAAEVPDIYQQQHDASYGKGNKRTKTMEAHETVCNALKFLDYDGIKPKQFPR